MMLKVRKIYLHYFIEFEWLKPELKNNYKGSNYKPPLLYYLESEKFPFHMKKFAHHMI